MKAKCFSVLTGLGFYFLFSALLFGAPKKSPVSEAGLGQPVRGIPGRAAQRAVINLSDLLQTSSAVSPAVKKGEAAPPFRPIPRKGNVPPEAVGRWQENAPAAPSRLPGALTFSGTPPPTVNFSALGDDGTRIPPDVHGAAGPNHLMTTLNSQVRIQNRTGGTISTVFLSTFWSSLGVTFPFDPKVLYDPYGGHWMFTACAEPGTSNSSLLMGVSRTSDPTGLWNLYRIDSDPADLVYADYPSMGFNKNWIVVNVNLFTVATDSFIRSDNFAFNKADLYAGGSGLFTRLSDLTGGGAITPALTYDTTITTMYLLEDWNGNSSGSGYLRLSTITGPVGAEIYTPGVALPSTPNPWDDFPPGVFVDFAPQLGSPQKIACNDARMQNTVYRNGFLWCAHTVFLPAGSSTRSSIQWWKISPAGAVSQRGRMDDPAGNLFYSFPSIAVNKNDAVLLGYSRFSTSQYAGGNYAYRVAIDPANTLRNDTVLKAGEATYYKTFGGGVNRWGDYTNTVVDPVNDVDIWTIQEYAATPANRWGTWWGKIGEPAVVDCNNNGLEDSVDIFILGTSQDCDSSRVPDECELPGNDADGDGILNACDNCPNLVNARGDMDGDGNLTATDVMLEFNCVYHQIGNCDICFADLNCDARLSPIDAAYELMAVFAGRPVPCTP